MMRRVALVGGTFDPIHRGHLDPVRAIAAQFRWDEILYIPAFRQPFKSDRQSASPFHRFAMAVLATSDDARSRVSPLELERGEISYTVDTLETLEARHPDRSFDWVIGDDNLDALTQWKRLDRILELANLIVLRRVAAGTQVPDELRARVTGAEQRPQAGGIVLADNEYVAVSSTDLRARLARGEHCPELPENVERYIERNHLYRGEGRD